MDTYPPPRAGPPRRGRRGSVPSRDYFLQNASRPATFLRRVPKGFFSTTSSLEESSLDDDEDDDAFAAVDAGAAASSVLAYLEARSSMSFVCHSKKPSLTFFFGATASLPATAEKPAVEQGLFLRAAGRGGGRRLARTVRAIAGAGARANPRGQMHLELAPFPASGGIESCGYAPDAAAKLPTTIADLIRIVDELCGGETMALC